MDNRRIVELTVGELEEIIGRAVKQSVAEVMTDFAMAADIQAQLAYEAEINNMLRYEMRAIGLAESLEAAALPEIDD